MAKKKRKKGAVGIVHQLEAAVLSNNADEAAEILKEQKPEYTARALGLACRFCGPDMVRTLLNGGASFSLYVKNGKQNPGPYPDTHIDDSFSDLTMARASYIFPAAEIDEFDKGHQVQPADVRKQNLQVLLDNNAIKPEEMLFHALCWDDTDLVDYLAEKGYRLTNGDDGFGAVVDGSLQWQNFSDADIFARSMFQKVLHLDDGAKMVRILQRMHELIASKEPVKLWLAETGVFDFDSTHQPQYAKNRGFRVGPKHIRPVLCSPDAFQWIVENTDVLQYASKRQMMYALVDEGNAHGLAYALEHKWVRGPSDLKYVMEHAQSLRCVSAEVNAVLLAEGKKLIPEEKKGTNALELKSGTTVAELNKLWSYSVNDDKTLTITSYKGTDTDVVIPEKIGRRTVTAIDSHAFDPENNYVPEHRRKARAAIISLDIPGTVRRIDAGTFGAVQRGWYPMQLIVRHPALRRVILHEGTQCIDEYAFYGCGALREINFPSTLMHVGSGAFADCTSLTEAIFTSSHKITIENNAFADCTSLAKVEIPEGALAQITHGAFAGCRKLAGWDEFRQGDQPGQQKKKNKKNKKNRNKKNAQNAQSTQNAQTGANTPNAQTGSNAQNAQTVASTLAASNAQNGSSISVAQNGYNAQNAPNMTNGSQIGSDASAVPNAQITQAGLNAPTKSEVPNAGTESSAHTIQDSADARSAHVTQMESVVSSEQRGHDAQTGSSTSSTP